MSAVAVANANRTWNARMAAKLAQRRRAADGHGQGLRGVSMRKPIRPNGYKPAARVGEHVKLLRTLETAQRRADAWRAELKRQEALEKADPSLFDICMHGHNTMPDNMAWPEAYDPWGMNWEAFEQQWAYDRSMRLYVKQ